MSKVLIDRAVLEATLEHAEFVSGAACEADDAIRAVLVAPSGTPELPVKAYYHESPNEYGGLNKSVGLEVRKTFADAPLVLESDALMQIACLEGEIAKRDARIVELEEDLAGTQSRVLSLQNQWRKLDAELAAIKAQEPVQVDHVAVMRADGDGGLEVEWLLEGGTAELMNGMYLCCVGGGTLLFEEGSGHLYAAPVSEAKAQGVVMPRDIEKSFLEWASAQLQAPTQLASYMAGADEVARLNATPVQQVSVPDGLELIKRMQVCLSLDDTEWGLSAPEKYKLLGDIKSYVLAAQQRLESSHD